MKNHKRPWQLQIAPLNRRDENAYCLPYMVALSQFENGQADEGCIAELSAHLRIAIYLKDCDSEIIDAGRKVINRIVREWKTIESYSEEDTEAVSLAIREYDRVVRFSGRGALQRATRKAMGK